MFEINNIIPIYIGVLVLPSAKKAGWHDFKIMKAGIPKAYAFNASAVSLVSWKPNFPLSNKTLIIKSEKLVKTNNDGMEKNNPIFKDIINSFENFFISFIAIDFDKEVNNEVLNAMPIIPKGNWATLSAK